MAQKLSFKNLLPWMAATAGGVLAFLGYAGFDYFYLEWICLVPILWAIRNQSPRRAFLIGWVAGIVGHGGGFYWVTYMFEQFAGMSFPLAFLGLVLLAAANGIVFAVWACVTRFIMRGTSWSVIWVSPVVWTAVEKVWPEIFPNYLGASQYELIALTQIADVTGILGVTFLLVYANSLIYAVLERRIDQQPFPRRQAAVFAAVIALTLTYGAVRIHQVDAKAAAAEKLTVGLAQVNLKAEEKHADRDGFLREHYELSRKLLAENKIDLMVWPENVLFVSLTSREGRLPAEALGDLKVPLLFGAVTQIDQHNETRYYNSAFLVDQTGQILGAYDKMTLVPFGEYIPMGDIFPVFYSWSPYSSRFWHGENAEPLMLGGHPLSVNICYEDIFPGQIRLLMKGGRDGRTPEAMFNITDDSWYGDTVEPMEHLALAGFRSIEHRRSLVRSTTTGISAIIDPVGRLALRTGQWTRESLVGKIPLMREQTLYARLGDWLGWLCLSICVFAVVKMKPWTRRRPQAASMANAKEGKRGRRPRKS